MLIVPDRHVQIDASWDAGDARTFIESLFRQTEEAFVGYWPPHPDDGEPLNGEHHANLYMGTAGVVWSQIELASHGYGRLRNKYVGVLEEERVATMARMKNGVPSSNRDDYLSGLLLAELGFMVPLMRLDPTDRNRQITIELISGNLNNRVLELMWGSPGSMLFLNALLTSGSVPQHQASLLFEGAAFLKNELTRSSSRGCLLWSQHLYGESAHLLGAVHGFAGNALAISKALPFLSDSDAAFWVELIRDTVKRSADREGRRANWQQSIDSHRSGRTDFLVQICHGAPGVIACLSDLMGEDEEFDELMIAGGNLTWDAGPLAKGGGFCHGTAGNGWAFLKLFEATADEIWLDRARRFAAAAIVQAKQSALDHGDHHYSLWTGDHGIAIFLEACMSGRTSLPTIEHF